MADTWHRGIEEFVLNRQKKTGGFGATPKLPATIQDTYHALRILTVLTRQGVVESPASGDGPLLEYLTRTSAAEHHNALVTFQRLAGIKLAGGEVANGPVLAFVRRRLAETRDLEERYYCGRLLREVARTENEGFDLLVSRRPAPWHFRTASELFMLLDLACGQTEDPSALAAWLQACQTGDGGFGFLPGTTSFIENCYDCLRALRLLGSAPKDWEGCQAFALACRTSRHGFARRNGGAAFLYSTWQAVAVLALLSHRLPLCENINPDGVAKTPIYCVAGRA